MKFLPKDPHVCKKMSELQKIRIQNESPEEKLARQQKFMQHYLNWYHIEVSGNVLEKIENQTRIEPVSIAKHATALTTKLLIISSILFFFFFNTTTSTTCNRTGFQKLQNHTPNCNCWQFQTFGDRVMRCCRIFQVLVQNDFPVYQLIFSHF